MERWSKRLAWLLLFLASFIIILLVRQSPQHLSLFRNKTAFLNLQFFAATKDHHHTTTGLKSVVNTDVVYYNRCSSNSSSSTRSSSSNALILTVPRIPKTGSENMAFLIRHLAAKVTALSTKLDGISPVDNRPSTDLLYYQKIKEKIRRKLHVTPDTCHVTPDT